MKPNLQRPVIIHRAILGSLERFMAILIEHLGGKWPLWLSPRQAKLLPISASHSEYCERVAKEMQRLGWEVEVDTTDNSLNKKVRNAQLKQFNYICVVGDEEMDAGLVDVRSREGERCGKLSIEGFIEKMSSEYPP